MGLSIQEQLLKAGLVDKKQVKKSEHDKRVQSKKKKKGGSPSEDHAAARLKQQQAQRAKKDSELNAARNQKAKIKADKASARQLIEANGMPLEEGEVVYHYVDADGKINRISVGQDTADNLSEGRMGLALYDNGLVLISSETALKVLERDKDVILVYNDPAQIEEDYPTDW